MSNQVKTRTSFTLEEKLLKRIKKAAYKNEMNASQFICMVMSEFLEGKKNAKPSRR